VHCVKLCFLSFAPSPVNSRQNTKQIPSLCFLKIWPNLGLPVSRVAVCLQLHRTNCQQHRTNCQQHRTNCQLHRTNCQQHRTNCQQHRTNCQLHRTNCQLHRTNRQQHCQAAHTLFCCFDYFKKLRLSQEPNRRRFGGGGGQELEDRWRAFVKTVMDVRVP
jgi:hypothetical protein